MQNLLFRRGGRTRPGIFSTAAKAAGVAAIALLLASVAPAKGAFTRPFTEHDLVRLERVAGPRLSGNERMLVYEVRTPRADGSGLASSLWVTDFVGPPRRIVGTTLEPSSPRWSADSLWIYFLGAGHGPRQLWRVAAAGGTAVQLSRVSQDVGSFAVAQGRLVISTEVGPSCEMRCPAKQSSAASGVLYDRLFARHWDRWEDGRRNHLFGAKLDVRGRIQGGFVPLTGGVDGDVPSKPFGSDADYALSPDGDRLFFSVRQAAPVEPWSTNFDIWQVAADGSSRPRNLTADNAGADVQPVLSRDGAQLAWRSQKRAGYESDRFAIMVRDLASGATREAAPGWDRSAERIAWSDDGRALYALAADRGQMRLFAVDLATGAVHPLTGAGRVTDFVAGATSVVFAQEAIDRPADLYRLDLASSRTSLVTRQNRGMLAGLTFGPFEQFSFPGWNGDTVNGYVVRPPGGRPGQRYPVMFIVHGGPEDSFGNRFDYHWNAASFSGRGFAVVMIEFHGSAGYGQAFTDAINRHWGDRPLEDLQKGWSFALARFPFLDGSRACALGSSFGGFMVNWIAGNWKAPWRCLVTHDGIFDTRMMHYATDELWFEEWENGGPEWQHPAAYARFNPVEHVAGWDRPMLIIHAGRDFRIPLEQGLGAFTALQGRCVPSRLLYFPDENHWVLRPANMRQWYETVEDWVGKWTAGSIPSERRSDPGPCADPARSAGLPAAENARRTSR